jgi:hypothetical protein
MIQNVQMLVCLWGLDYYHCSSQFDFATVRGSKSLRDESMKMSKLKSALQRCPREVTIFAFCVMLCKMIVMCG